MGKRAAPALGAPPRHQLLALLPAVKPVPVLVGEQVWTESGRPLPCLHAPRPRLLRAGADCRIAGRSARDINISFLFETAFGSVRLAFKKMFDL